MAGLFLGGTELGVWAARFLDRSALTLTALVVRYDSNNVVLVELIGHDRVPFFAGFNPWAGLAGCGGAEIPHNVIIRNVAPCAELGVMAAQHRPK
jgi:hypothetical protein